MKIINRTCFFWKEFLSNWNRSDFIIDNIKYCCVEQYMMAMKAALFNDIETLEKIMATTKPSDHKRLGRSVKDFDLETWNKWKYNFVFAGTQAKYMQNPELKEKLLAIDVDLFVEASPEDNIWGIGLSEEDPLIEDIASWKGENLLGKIITEVRRVLKLQCGIIESLK